MVYNCAKKHNQNSGPGAPKLKSGGLLGRFGGVLRHLGPSGAVLEAFWSVLEASLKSLGPSWAEKGGQHGSKLGAKTAPESIKNESKNRSVL